MQLQPILTRGGGKKVFEANLVSFQSKEEEEKMSVKAGKCHWLMPRLTTSCATDAHLGILLTEVSILAKKEKLLAPKHSKKKFVN